MRSKSIQKRYFLQKKYIWGAPGSESRAFAYLNFFCLSFQIGRDSFEWRAKSFLCVYVIFQNITVLEKLSKPYNTNHRSGLKVYEVIWFKQKIYTKEIKLISSPFIKSIARKKQQCQFLTFTTKKKNRSLTVWDGGNVHYYSVVLRQDNRTEACVVTYSKVNIF